MKPNGHFRPSSPLGSLGQRRSDHHCCPRARLRRGQELAAEAAALDADEADRTEMLAVASLMESLRAPG